MAGTSTRVKRGKMREEESIDVYWSPQTSWEFGEQDWNMLYPEPISLFSELQKLKTEDSGVKTYFSCPATNRKFKNTFVFRNELSSSYQFDFTKNNDENTFEPISSTWLNYEIKRPPTISVGPLVTLNLYYSFFASEPLTGVFTPPMMHEPRYTKYGTCIPGEFDVGQWFRPYPLEIQMWKNKGEFHLEEGEPIFYLEFKTDKKINLKRYKMNGAINSYLVECSTTTNTWGMGVPLSKRYERFKRTNMRELILKEIKQNLLEG
jgi:hypothetical protein